MARKPAPLKFDPPLGNRPVLQYLRPDQLLIDPEYQRAMDGRSTW
jgi:hypothetical protein